MPDKDWLEFIGSEWIEKEVKVIHFAEEINKNYRKLFHKDSKLIFHSRNILMIKIYKINWGRIKKKKQVVCSIKCSEDQVRLLKELLVA